MLLDAVSGNFWEIAAPQPAAIRDNERVRKLVRTEFCRAMVTSSASFSSKRLEAFPFGPFGILRLHAMRFRPAVARMDRAPARGPPDHA